MARVVRKRHPLLLLLLRRWRLWLKVVLLEARLFRLFAIECGALASRGQFAIVPFHHGGRKR